MTSYPKTVARSRGTGTGRPLTHRARSRALMVLGGAAVVALAACTDSNIPFYTAPTSVPSNPGGIQNALTGLFSATRIDLGTMTITYGADYARDGSVFTNTEPRTVTYPTGVQQTPTSSGGVWPQDYQNILQAQQIIAAVPNVAPAYAAPQAAAIIGVTETLEAMNYMMVAEAHDTIGIAIRPAGNLTAPPPAVCNSDAWTYIVALLDSANTQLTAAGAITVPVTLPVGFQGVKVAGPSTVAGTFASFNRALAAKANLELAYALNRIAPIDSTFGPNDPAAPVAVPNVAAVTAAAAALAASGMYDETKLAPTNSSGFVANAYNVVWDFSSQSGDVTNPIFGSIGTLAVLKDLVAGVDTNNDLRWKAKFKTNPNTVQQPTYSTIANITAGGKTWSYLYNMSTSPSSTIPVARIEGLVLLNAQILLAEGNFAGSIAKSNLVRTVVGGLPPVAAPATYLGARNLVLQEQRISMTMEPWAIRMISLRMYGLQRVADTTWNNPGPAPLYHLTTRTQESAPQTTYNDWHTVVNPVPLAELTGRGNNNVLVTTCSTGP